MSDIESPVPGAGRLGVDAEALRSFGQTVAEHASTIAGLGFRGVFDQVVMPDSPLAQALADAGSACEAALERVHKDFTFAGDESVADSRRFDEHEQTHTDGFRAAGERIQEIGDRARTLGGGL